MPSEPLESPTEIDNRRGWIGDEPLVAYRPIDNGLRPNVGESKRGIIFLPLALTLVTVLVTAGLGVALLIWLVTHHALQDQTVGETLRQQRAFVVDEGTKAGGTEARLIGLTISSIAVSSGYYYSLNDVVIRVLCTVIPYWVYNTVHDDTLCLSSSVSVDRQVRIAQRRYIQQCSSNPTAVSMHRGSSISPDEQLPSLRYGLLIRLLGSSSLMSLCDTFMYLFHRRRPTLPGILRSSLVACAFVFTTAHLVG